MAEADAVTTVFRGPNACTVKRALTCSGSRNRCLTETIGLVSGVNEGNPGPHDHGFLPHSDAASMKKGRARVLHKSAE